MLKNIVQLRDLLYGKRNYNLFVKINKEYRDAFDVFKSALLDYINKNFLELRVMLKLIRT